MERVVKQTILILGMTLPMGVMAGNVEPSYTKFMGTSSSSAGASPTATTSAPSAAPTGQPSGTATAGTVNPYALSNTMLNGADQPAPEKVTTQATQPAWRSQVHDQNDPTNRQVQSGSKVVKAKPKPFIISYPKKSDGRPVYRVEVYETGFTATLYQGLCKSKVTKQLRQKVLDMGLESRRKKILRLAKASTRQGRVRGCWYYDADAETFNLAFENGQAETFAREQISSLRR